MSRFVRLCLVPALLALASCGGGGQGSPGAPGVGDPYFPKAGNGGYDVSHYALDLRYAPETRRLTGTATLTARATQDLSSFHLDLTGLTVDDVTVEGEEAGWERAGQELIVRPAGVLDDGETFAVRIRYSGTPRTITDPDGSEEGWLRTHGGAGALALGEPNGSMTWFPGNHHPSDKASYTLSITVPKGVAAVSNGELTGERTGHGRTTYHWRTAEPMASYLATLAIGAYDVRRATAGDVPAHSAVARGESGRQAMSELPGVLAWAEDSFGPYPFSSTGVIIAPADATDYALETQNRPVFPGAPDTLLLVHELAHQWFGNSVTPKSWQDMWLNEGFATYAEWLWEEQHGGDSAETTFRGLYASDDADLWAFPPAEPPGAEHISDRPVYERGAMVVHKIRQAVGDAAFGELVRGWTAEHRHGNADTEDFTAYVEQQAPEHDFGPLWADWLYGEGKPERP
ncbi:M1 family metallopeptidase [Streptomyces sp. G1]|nr:M1 family metallopeptidase [Streptomyces sp. G1]MCM1968846.1 M1 family metallopeptidase [Streptomyces sp. G1]